MTLETFRGPDLPRVLALVRAACGEDAMIVKTRGPAETGDGQYEVVVADSDQIVRFRRVLEGPAAGGRAVPETRVHAFVGPAGGGKTTTLAKLALHASAFGGRTVGLLSLDTYRVGGVEHLQTYADIAGLPFDVAYDEHDVAGALRRMEHCDVVLIDTPGRGTTKEGVPEWMRLLAAADPDEVHLVLPAGVRADVAAASRRSFQPCGITHVLLTRLDEVPFERGVAELAEMLHLPARWVTCGPEVPVDLAAAPARIMSSLGAADVGIDGLAVV